MSRLLFITGSLRKASSSRALATAVAERLEGACEPVFANIGDLPHYNADLEGNPTVAEFNDAVANADGVVIVTPEYNYSVPGVLKNALDWASRPAMNSVFRDKPVFVITVSAGALGGARAQSHLKYILNGMLAKVPAFPEVAVAKSNAAMQDGIFADTSTIDFTVEKVSAFLNEISA